MRECRCRGAKGSTMAGRRRLGIRAKPNQTSQVSATILIFFPTLLFSRTFLRFISLFFLGYLSVYLSLCLASLSKTRQRERVKPTLKSLLPYLPPRFLFYLRILPFLELLVLLRWTEKV